MRMRWNQKSGHRNSKCIGNWDWVDILVQASHGMDVVKQDEELRSMLQIADYRYNKYIEMWMWSADSLGLGNDANCKQKSKISAGRRGILYRMVWYGLTLHFAFVGSWIHARVLGI